jgi:hypothetical protein
MSKRPDKIQREVMRLMRKVGVSPAVIYAYEKTGFLLLKESYKSLPPEDRAEYDAAIAEYRAQELTRRGAKR